MKSIYVKISAILILTAAILWVPDTAKAAVNCSDPGVICKSGTLAADETWTPDNIYVITGGDLTVPTGRTLTIQPGAIVKFDLDRELILEGTLTANGTEGNPVYFTSLRDDTLGGDTNHSTTPPSFGDWDRIYFRDNSSGTLAYVEFRYGGDSYNNWGMLHTDAASVTVDHGKFKDSVRCAINSHPAYEATLINMTSDDFTGNQRNGLCLRGGALNQNAVWDETEVAYVILSDLTVASSQTLTWSAGIVIKPVGDTAIIVDGTLNANGTPGGPVYVTSIHDDTLGGNTDNQTTMPAAGDWDRVYYRDNSSGMLTYLEFGYGGDSYNNWGMLHTDAAGVTVDHGKFRNSIRCAINSHPAYEVTLTNMTSDDFNGNQRNGLCLRGGALNQNTVWDETEVAYVILSDLTLASGQTLTWSAGIVIKPVGDTAIIVDGTLIASGTPGNLVYVTSIHDDTLGGNTDNQTTMPAAGDWDRVYYRDNSNGTLTYAEFRYGGDSYNNWGMLHTDVTDVTVDHGKFKDSVRCAISSHPAYEATLTNMTSDDFSGNQRNGLCLRGGALNQNAVWDETEVAYVILSDLTVASSQTLTWSAGIVVKPVGDTAIIVDGTLNANGTSNTPVYVTSIHNDALGGNTDNATTPPAPGDWDRIYFHDNSSGTLAYVEFRYGGDSYNNWGMLHTDAASVTVDHGKFKNSVRCAINSHSAYEATLINMTSDDFTGNQYNGLCIRGGALNQDAVWDETEVAYVVYGELSVASSKTLTWAAGIVVKPVDGNTQIVVDGVLNANGTPGGPVYVTSIHDDTLGGNTDNQTTMPAAGDWDRVYFRDNSSGTLTNVEFRYGGDRYNNYAAIQINESSPSINNCILQMNMIGIRVEGTTSDPIIKNNRIFGNQKYGVFNGTSGHWIDATNNWWGSNSGPYDPSSSGTDGDYNDAGSGDRVNDYVLYRPWLGIDFDNFEIFLPLIRR